MSGPGQTATGTPAQRERRRRVTAAHEVAAVLEVEPGRTPVEVRDFLRRRGRVSITTADVARVLAGSPGRFRADDRSPPRWWPAHHPEARVRAAPRLPSLPGLYTWQREALDAWRQRGCRGVVEAVTGTGKTLLGVAAAGDELVAGGQVAILVPTTELLFQWRHVLERHLPPSTSVGLLGGGQYGDLGRHDVLVAVVNSARGADLRPRRPGGLLVADECHRYGTDGNQTALDGRFPRRLGLSATYARPDDGHLAWLTPYFGGTCFRMGYRRALADGVTARFAVTLMGVDLTVGERAVYDELTFEMSRLRAQLIAGSHVPADPVSAFFVALTQLARRDREGSATARRYLRAMQERRHLLAETPAKTHALLSLAPGLAAADRAIVFTQSITAAEAAADTLLDAGLRAEATHSGKDRATRRAVLARFAAGELDVVSAPQILDEGVDVPAADTAVIMAASRSRRQMVQRMGRILRPKPDGRPAHFIVVFAQGTTEDPALGAHEGFLEEITELADTVTALAVDVPVS